MSDETVSLRDAKARLSELAQRAADGVDTVIAKHGRPTARLTAARGKRKRIDLHTLQELTCAIPQQPETAARVLRRLRDSERY